jgi:hypothetical protein
MSHKNPKMLIICSHYKAIAVYYTIVMARIVCGIWLTAIVRILLLRVVVVEDTVLVEFALDLARITNLVGGLRHATVGLIVIVAMYATDTHADR